MGISVIIPSYLEADNLRILIPKLNKELKEITDEYEILILDTVEPLDNTRDACEELSATYTPRTGGNTYGDAIRTGIANAQYEWIIAMDADCSHDPSDIKRLYNKATKGYDVVIASRYTKGGNSHNGFILKCMSKIVNLCYRIIFKIKAKDVSNSYRIYSASKLKEIKLTCDNFDIVEEILIILQLVYPQLKYTEIPVFFAKRQHGESKRQLVKFVFSYIKTIRELTKIKKTYK